MGACMFARIQGYLNDPMGLIHGGAVMFAVGSINFSKFVTLGSYTLPTKAKFLPLCSRYFLKTGFCLRRSLPEFWHGVLRSGLLFSPLFLFSK